MLSREREMPRKELDIQEQAVVDALFENVGLTSKEVIEKLGIDQEEGKGILARKRVKREIVTRQEELRYETMISAKRVLEEEACIAFSDISELVDENGDLIPPHELPERVRRAITVEIRQERDKNGAMKGPEFKYTMIPKAGALERISKHLGLYEKDNLQKAINMYFVSHGDESIPERIPQAEVVSAQPIKTDKKTIALIE